MNKSAQALPMKAYHGKQELKDLMVAEAVKHREMDELVKEVYGHEVAGKFQGCAVGCTIRTIRLKVDTGADLRYSDHGAYEKFLGIPWVLAHLEDWIFERLPLELAMTWPERFLQAPAVGTDLTGVGDKFLHWLLVDSTEGVIKFAKTDQSRKVIEGVGNLYAKKLSGETVTEYQWQTARRAAANAAYSDAAAAANAAAHLHADAASAAIRVVNCADKTKMHVRQSEKLLELMAWEK